MTLAKIVIKLKQIKEIKKIAICKLLHIRYVGEFE
jgi:hypothetical protein